MTMGQDQSLLVESLQVEEALRQSRINEIASERNAAEARRQQRLAYEARVQREEAMRQRRTQEEARQRLINDARRLREANEARQREAYEISQIAMIQARQRVMDEAKRHREANQARQRQTIKQQLDCTCQMSTNIKTCKKCTLTFCGQCTTYQYFWLPIDMCNTCVIMVFTEEMSREDIYTLNFKQLKTYLRNYDIPFIRSHNKLELVDSIIANRPLKDEQHRNYIDKRLKEWTQQLNKPRSETDKVTILKKLERYQQERFQVYLMKRENRLSQAEYDSAIKNIPLKITIPTTSPAAPTSSSSSLVNQHHPNTSSTYNSRNNNNNNNTSSPSTSNNNNKNNHHKNKGKQKSTNNNNNTPLSSPNNKRNNQNNNSRNKGKQKETNNNNNNNASMKKNTPDTPKDEEDKTCKICFDAERSCVFVECGHFLSCYECGLKLLETSATCPICRSFILKVVKLFKA